MKLLAIAASLLLATPALACPFHDQQDKAQETPKTADKAKTPDKAPAKQDAPKQDAPKQDTAKAKDAPAPAKKPGDKVSLK
ncbi:MAG TPA: hypothetical protein VMJ10_37075 [Kofleriaceae bacterium]|nr:hypothetical protein [Kofleriaceae bacterium]